MRLILEDELLFLDEITVSYKGKSVVIPKILVDTGSASTAIETDWLVDINIMDDDPNDRFVTVIGIGGSELMMHKTIELGVDTVVLPHFGVQIGRLQYGFGINGILGLDFLLMTKAFLDFESLVLTFRTS